MIADSQQGKSNQGQVYSQTYKIITQYGDMLVVKQGINSSHHHHHHHHQQQQPNQHQGCANNVNNSQQQQQEQQQQSRPVIMTFHDLGLNSELQFATFCECDEVKLMLQTFNMIHVNFIGQEFSSGGQVSCANLPNDYKYPSVEQMAECIVDVCVQLRIRSFIALAVGAGAHIVSLLALMRPDLVDGLFLINPIVTSCSITEWLYFKMSAIASSHHIGGDQQQQHGLANSNSPGGENASGLRKLLNAAHIHVGHSSNNRSSSPTPADNSAEELGQVQANCEDDTASVGQMSSSSSIGPGVTQPQAGGSRLRRLILSRNFRLGGGSGHHHHQQQQRRHQSPPVHGARPSSASASESAGGARQSTESPTSTASARLERKNSHGSNGSTESRGSATGGGKRPPYEYLTYHHFGPNSFQRYRRRSSDAGTQTDSATGSPARKLGTGNEQSPAANESPASHSASGGRRATGTGSGAPTGRGPGDSPFSRSHDSLVHPTGASQAAGQRARSGSVCMSANYLASIPSDRQRHAYMQGVYKHYFSQLNSHNLWLFAQSFAKRRTLNLRKDCGAAAHAAAAAAALGTSICTAFVGTGPAPATSGARPTSAGSEQPQRNSATSGSLAGASKLEAKSSTCTSQQHKQQALVAGTKVKRTFTCQTLIMCSSIQLHCERAFKLMSLLNPLQATWIKSDQMLVLEERPEKVCQALRLFLQGIGYSMSTYERRLRLSSATGSASSMESNSSARSSSNEKG